MIGSNQNRRTGRVGSRQRGTIDIVSQTRHQRFEYTYALTRSLHLSSLVSSEHRVLLSGNKCEIGL